MVRFIRSLNVVFSAALLASVAKAGATETQMSHNGPRPIKHWRFHQPRRSDLTPQQNAWIDRLYLQKEKEHPDLIAPDFRPQ